MDQFFTLYFKNGKREIISGESINEAFTKAGYGAGALAAVDWYDQEASETHYYDREQKTWIKYEPLRIHAEQFKDVTQNELLRYLNQHHAIIVTYEQPEISSGSDQLILEVQHGVYYPEGLVKTITLSYNEFHEGSYFEEGTEDGYYMVCNTLYFHPDDQDEAVKALMARYQFGTEAAKTHARTIAEIAARQ